MGYLEVCRRGDFKLSLLGPKEGQRVICRLIVLVADVIQMPALRGKQCNNVYCGTRFTATTVSLSVNYSVLGPKQNPALLLGCGYFRVGFSVIRTPIVDET